jgi:hypothetical protein
MAHAGGTMPAQLIEQRENHYVVTHREGRPSSVLIHDVDEAEALLNGIGKVWIPAILRADLEYKLRQPVKPVAVMEAQS